MIHGSEVSEDEKLKMMAQCVAANDVGSAPSEIKAKIHQVMNWQQVLFAMGRAESSVLTYHWREE